MTESAEEAREEAVRAAAEEEPDRAWEEGDESLVVRRNGLAEGRLFGANSDRSFTWRADGPTLRLTFGQVARDTIEYRGTIDEAGRLVVEGDKGSCVLKRARAGSP